MWFHLPGKRTKNLEDSQASCQENSKYYSKYVNTINRKIRGWEKKKVGKKAKQLSSSWMEETGEIDQMKIWEKKDN